MESYSQFGEDALIRGYLSKIAYARHKDPNKFDKGFFVDVGCYHPTTGSNTKWLSSIGWTGINIDAAPGTKEIFDKERPNDTNLWALVTNSKVPITFYTWGKSVYNTSSKTVADELVSKRGFAPPKEITPPNRSLLSIFEEHRPSGVIDILSVDAEGADIEVLKSNDWSQYRPRLILVEEHSNSIEAVVTSEVYKYITALGYRLYAWAQPTLIFEKSI